MVYGYMWELECRVVALDVFNTFDGVRGLHVSMLVVFQVLAESAFHFFEDASHF